MLVTMYIAKVFTLIYLFISKVNCLSIFGHRDGVNYLLEEINDTLTTFDSSNVETEWVEQPLDHFSETDNRTWKMKYFQRLDMWKTDGPIYLFIGGEGAISKGWAETGTTYELAKETNGAVFISEHRYYGASKPFNDFTTENLAYLSARQALADLASFLTNMKSKPEFVKSKVIAVGGSYAGNLAAWLKLLYPNLVDAAVASSAPVQAKTDFYEYLETVSDDFEQNGTPGCHELIENIFKNYERKLKTKDGIEKLKEEEQICADTDMTNLVNQQLFFLAKASNFMGIAQYGDVNYIKQYCGKLNESARVFPEYDDEMVAWNEKQRCYDYEFDSMIEDIKNIDWYMAWIYQTCTEYGYYQTTTSNNHPFTNSIPVEFFFKMCTDLFGKGFDGKRVENGVKKTNEMYGGLQPNVSKVVFVNGELDPWHRLSILEDVSYEAPAKVIPFSSHCRDLLSNRESDPEELKEARKYVKYIVKRWIGAGEYANN